MNAKSKPWPKLVAPGLGLAIVGLSVALNFDPTGGPLLVLDDFAYLAESRTWDRLRASLFVPHNAHVVPLFRLLTYLLVSASGSLANVPLAFELAAIGALVLTMLVVGHFVAREARSMAVGLAAMAGLGITTVMRPAATWYSASQAIWSGLVIVSMLVLLQSWRIGGGRWRLIAAAFAAFLAPAFWSGGYLAGPVGAAYLAAERGTRKATVVPMISMILCLLLSVFSNSRIFAAANFHDRPLSEAARPLRGLLYTCQAIVEVELLGNLGIDAEVAPMQGIVLVAAIAALWTWSRRSDLEPSPMEAAGATLMLGGYWLVYTMRGYFPWESLRSLGWYHAIPHVGAVVFAAGWWSARGKPGWSAPIGWRAALLVLALVVGLFALHQPRVRRSMIEGAPAMTAAERASFPTPELRILRARYYSAEDVSRQRSALVRLDRAGSIARRSGLGRAEIRHALGRVEVPGWPSQIRGYDALDLLELPESGGAADAATIRRDLAGWLRPVPPTRPPWLTGLPIP